MPYVKTDWETGDLITAEAMNNMEDGIGDAVDAAEDALDKVSGISFALNNNMELVVTL